MGTIFYSWQSDLPNAINRGFIQDALEKVAKKIRDDDSINIDPVIDRDTSGVPGSPDIGKVIFNKIDNALIFVCDVSIIYNIEPRPMPNPNVLVELGYALKSLGENRVIMVMNTAFGMPDLLPFDLRMKRICGYSLSDQAQDRTPEKKKLVSILEDGIIAILKSLLQKSH